MESDHIIVVHVQIYNSPSDHFIKKSYTDDAWCTWEVYQLWSWHFPTKRRSSLAEAKCIAHIAESFLVMVLLTGKDMDSYKIILVMHFIGHSNTQLTCSSWYSVGAQTLCKSCSTMHCTTVWNWSLQQNSYRNSWRLTLWLVKKLGGESIWMVQPAIILFV